MPSSNKDLSTRHIGDMDFDGNILIDSAEEFNGSDTDSAFGSARWVEK